MTVCYHCHLPIAGKVKNYVAIDDQKQPMCCPGCAAVAQLIVDNGLEEYYRFRTRAAVTQKIQEPMESRVTLTENSGQQRLLVKGIVCSACVWLIERRLLQLPGMLECQVHLHTQQAWCRFDKTQIQPSQIIETLQQLGYHALPYMPAAQEEQRQLEYQEGLKRLAVSGLGMMQVMMHAVTLYIGKPMHMQAEYVQLFQWTSMLLTAIVLFYAGTPFFRNAWRAFTCFTVNMDVPIVIALIGASLLSMANTWRGQGDVYFDSICMFLFLLTTSRFLALLAKHKAADTLLKLQQATPTVATRYHEGVAETVPVEKLQVGEELLVRAGEYIPCDGVVTWGQAFVSDAILTGEAMGKRKTLGDDVFSGSYNLEHSFVMRISKTEHSTLNTLIKLLSHAQNARPPLVRLADNAAKTFIAVVLLIALACIFFYWSTSPEQAIVIAMTVLVATCPCALSLAAPTAITVAANRLAAAGFLLLHPKCLEHLPTITDVVFDKTGTLTESAFSLISVQVLQNHSEAHVLALAASLEHYSAHPIAKAFAHIDAAHIAFESVNTPCSDGIEGYWQGHRYRLGRAEYVAALLPHGAPEMPTPHERLWVLLGNELGPLAWFGLDSKVRTDAAEVLSQLQQRGLQCHLLSGDTQMRVSALAHELSFQQVRANASPQDKLDYVQQLQYYGKRVLMVGDGLNDAPVLAASCLSVAMSDGSDLAKANADAVIMNQDVTTLTVALATASRLRQIIQQNIAWAIGYNLIVLPWAATGRLSPYLAALGMSLSSLWVLANALRLRLAYKTTGISGQS